MIKKLRNSNLNLPSNHKFGYFFIFVFLIASTYFYLKASYFAFYTSCTLSLVLLLITIFKADLLSPFNKLWMSFGFVLGMIVSPIVMGLIFYIIFTPIGILMRLFGRDELLLKFKIQPSFWTKRNEDIHSNSFRSQF